MAYINTDLFETTYTDPSEQDWKLSLRSQVPLYTGAPLGAGAAPLSAATGYVILWTWNNNNDPDTGGNFPGTRKLQVDETTLAPFTNYSSAEAFTLTSAFLDSDLIDHSTVEIVETSDPRVPQNWYYYNLDMAYPGLKIRWEGDVDDINKSILGSSADISVYVDDAQEALLSSAVLQTEFNLSLSVYKKDADGDFVDWWHGIALPESISSEVKDGKRLMDLSFTDGLSLLNDIDFKNDDGTPVTGQLSFKQLFMQSLRKLPHFGNVTHKEPGGTGSTQFANTRLATSVARKIVDTYTGPLWEDYSGNQYYEGDTLTAGTLVKKVYNQGTAGGYWEALFAGGAPTITTDLRGLQFASGKYMQFKSNSGAGFSNMFNGTDARTLAVSADNDGGGGAMIMQTSSLTSGAPGYGMVQYFGNVRVEYDGAGFETYTSSNGQNVFVTTLASGGTVEDTDIYINGVAGVASGVGAATTSVNTTAASSLFMGIDLENGGFYTGRIYETLYTENVLSSTDRQAAEAELTNYLEGGSLSTEVKGAWTFNTYGTPQPVVEDYNEWDSSLSDPLSQMFCPAESFNEPKKEYDRKFEMRPDTAFMSTGHVIEDICKTLGMVLTHWEGGWHLYSPTYLYKATDVYSKTNDATLAPHVRRWTWNISDGLQESTYEAVDIDKEIEDYAAPSSGMTKSFGMPYRAVQMVHEKSPSDILYQSYSSNPEGQSSLFNVSFHKVAADHPGSPIDFSTASNIEKYGDAVNGYSGNNAQRRAKRRGTMWTMSDAYYQDGHSFDANGGAQGSNLAVRAQHKRLEDGVTGGGPNLNFYDGRYLGPDSGLISNIDLEAGETLNIEMGGYVENGRLDDHIGQTYIFHHRIELLQATGVRYRLRRHVRTQDTWSDTGTERKITIEGGNGDVDKGWPGDKTYYIKEYDSLSWVKQSDVSTDEWEDCWYEVMSFHPETTKTEGDTLAEANLTALPYYGHAPIGTVYDEDEGVLTVDKENRFAYVKEDLALELPGTEGVDEFITLIVETGMSMYGPSQGPRPVHGFAGTTAKFASRKKTGTLRKDENGGAITIASGGTGSTIDMPYAMGWNKFVIRYGNAGEKNSLETYGDGGAGTRTYKAGSSRLGSRFVFTNPEFRGRIKVRHQDGSGGLGDKTFFTQWRPAWSYYALSSFVSSIHELVAYEILDVVGYVRERFVGAWQKHPGTTQGGCPAPFIPVVTRCLDPDSAVRVIPYRMSWQFAEGFKMEAVQIADAYEKTREVLVVGDTADGGSSGTVKPAQTRIGGIGSASASANNRPSVELVGSGSTAFAGGTTIPFGKFQYSNGVDDGFGSYFTELHATNPVYIDNTLSYMNKFSLVDASTMSLYGAQNLGRLVVDEPGMYLVELKGRMDNNLASGTNTYGFTFHRLGTVAANAYTGDTSLKGSNVIESFGLESNNTGTGNYLDGVWTEQVRLERGDLITFGSYNTGGAGQSSIYNEPEALKIRLIKLSEQPG